VRLEVGDEAHRPLILDRCTDLIEGMNRVKCHIDRLKTASDDIDTEVAAVTDVLVVSRDEREVGGAVQSFLCSQLTFTLLQLVGGCGHVDCSEERGLNEVVETVNSAQCTLLRLVIHFNIHCISLVVVSVHDEDVGEEEGDERKVVGPSSNRIVNES
jgi:hypothetical protein